MSNQSVLKRLKQEAHRRLQEEYHEYHLGSPMCNCTCCIEDLWCDDDFGQRTCIDSCLLCCCCGNILYVAMDDCYEQAQNNRRVRQLARIQLHQREQVQADYTQALESGEVLVAYGRIMMVGPGGVGKSSLLRGLMKLPLQSAESTILADTSKVKYLWARTGAHPSSYWSNVTESDEIEEVASLCTTVLRRSPHRHGGGSGSGSSTVITTQPAASAVAVFAPEGVSADRFSSVTSEYKKLITETEEYVVDTFLLPSLRRVEHGQVRTKTPESEVRLHIWDCGGQPVFLDVLPAFMTSRTLFMLFFDASKNLQGKCKTVINKQGRTVLSKEQNVTQVDLMLQWMASIHATLTDETTDGIIPKCPRIIPIGTHGDDPTVAGKQKEILADLTSHFAGKAFASLLWNGVVVDNTTAGRYITEDPAYEYIRTEVREYVKSSLTVRTPVVWVLFRKILQKIAEGNPVLSYAQAAVVGNICGIAPRVVPSVLNFYHELGVVLYYAFIDSLNNHIIADPQWLIQQLGKLLALEGLECVPGNQLMWNLLREKGILVQHLYELVWENSEVKPEGLMNLLEHFLLAAPINTQSQIHTFRGREYFVPCMLGFYSRDDSCHQSNPSVKDASPLHLLFNTQYVPPGFFTRLATAMTKDSHCRLVFRQGIFRNQITVSYGDGEKIDEITITEHTSSIEISVARIAPRKVHHLTFQNACQEILKLLLSCSSDVCQWLISIKVSTAFKCDHCSQTNTPKQFIPIPPSATTRSTLQCDKCGCHDATPKQQCWLKIHPLPQEPDQLCFAELQGVAQRIMSSGKLKEIADALELLPQLQSVESEPNPAFTLLQRWSRHGGQVRSTLVHYLRQIGLRATADNVEYQELHSVAGSPAFNPERVNSKRESAECRTFRKCFSFLADGISDPGHMAVQLYSKELIGADLRTEALKPAVEEQVKIGKLLSAVEDQIVSSPATKFRQFIDILRNEPSLQHLATKLESTCREMSDS